MERLRDHMEAAIRERWQERPLAERPAERERPREKFPDTQRPARALEAPIRAPASEIRALPVRDETLARNRIVAAQPESPEGEAYLALQAAVLQRIDEKGLRVIGVTSPTAGGGKTLTSVNLAVGLAVHAHRPTMILDFDLNAPEVHKLFDIDRSIGLEDHLFKGIPVADVLFSPSIKGVSILPARGSVRAANEVIRSGQLAKVLEIVKRDYPEEILVLDLPSLNSASDGKTFEALADGILLVVEDDVTEERHYRRALESFSKQKLIGTVLNRVPPYRGEL